jgi:N-acetylmuramoyl-L-alanine amidase
MQVFSGLRKKSLGLTMLIVFFLCLYAHSQENEDVIVKFNQRDSECRLVLEANEELINKAKVTVTDKKIFVDFLTSINLIYKKKIPLDMKVENGVLILTLEQKSEVRTLKLKDPARLVFDFKNVGVIEKVESAQEIKDQKDIKVDEKRQAEQRSIERKTVQIASKVFVIDPGHGGYEFGITDGMNIEKNIVLMLAREMETRLKNLGKKVYLIRRVDQYVSISDRIEYVNQKKPDIFLSIHLSSDNKIVMYVPRIEDVSSDNILNLYNVSKRQAKSIEKSKALVESLKKAFEEDYKVKVEKRGMPIPLLNSVSNTCAMIEFPSPKYFVYDEKARTGIINTIIKGISYFER